MNFGKSWTDADDNLLFALYNAAPPEAISEQMEVPRSVDAIKRRAARFGLEYQYTGPRVTVQTEGLPPGFVRVVQHRMIG